MSPLVEIFAFFYDIGINIKFLIQGKITRIKSPLRRPPRAIFVDHPFPIFSSRTNDTDNTTPTHNTHNHEISPGRPGYSWPSNEAWEGSHTANDALQIAHLSGYPYPPTGRPLCGTLPTSCSTAKRQRRRKSGAIVIRWRSTPGQRTRPGELLRQPAGHEPIANLSG